MAIECDRWNWRELIASEHGPRSPTTRHVLLTLSLHMNEHGENAWPSQELLAKRTKLTERAVRKHLELAAAEGFVSIRKRRRDMKAWFVHQYTPIVPQRLEDLIKAAPWEEDPKYQRPERGSARSLNEGQRPERGAERPERDDTTPGTSFPNARNHVPNNSSSNSSKNYPKERAAEDRTTGVFLNKGESQREDPERKHQPFPETPTSAQEAFQGKSLKSMAQPPAGDRWIYTEEELKERIRPLVEKQIPADLIVKVLRQFASEANILRILAADHSVPRISAA